MIQREIEANPRSDLGIQAVILEPTRELAIQVQSQIDKFTSLKSVLVYGGASSAGDQSKLF